MIGVRLIRLAGTRMAGRVLMMRECHALSCHHGSHALQRHDQRDQQCEKTNETRVHSSGFYIRHSTLVLGTGSLAVCMAELEHDQR